MEANLKSNGSQLPPEFGLQWTTNAYEHTVWKLAGYARFLNQNHAQYLRPRNIVFHMVKKYKQEFISSRLSFFQRVIQGDQPIARHFVAVVASAATEGSKLVMELSDGAYTLEAIAEGCMEANPSSPQKTCQEELYRLWETGKIFVGQKLHFINQNLICINQDLGDDGEQANQHWFLQNRRKYRIGLNYNGIYPASFDAKLGLQRQLFLLRNLGNVISDSVGGSPAAVSMVDVVVVKKFPIYFTEEFLDGGKADDHQRGTVLLRSYQTKKYLCD